MYDQLTWTQLTLIYFNSHPNVHPTHSYFLVYICTHWRWCKKFCTLLRLENQCVSIRCCHWSSLCWYSHDVCFSSLSDMCLPLINIGWNHIVERKFFVFTTNENETIISFFLFIFSSYDIGLDFVAVDSLMKTRNCVEETKISRKSPNRLMIVVFSSIDQTSMCKHNRRL